MAFSISPKLKLLFIFLHLFSLTHLSLSNSNNLPLDTEERVRDVHEFLPMFNLPIGLLPGNVKSYHLAEDNSFTVELTHKCHVRFGKQQAYYKTNIKGKLDYDKVYDVKGIEAKKLFLWVSVDSMKVDEKSNMIEFHVGPFTKKLSVKDFETIPVCKEQDFRETESASI